MPITPRKHGVNIIEVKKGSIPRTVVASSIWAVVVSASDADVATFPAGKAVLVTDPEAAYAKAGEAGTAAVTLKAIADCGPSIGVVVRIDEPAGATPAEIEADQTVKVIAALQAIRLAEQTLQIRPRIIAAPGLDDEPVAVALGVLAPKLNGMAYARSEGDTPEEVAAYREKFAVRELMLIDRDLTAPRGVDTDAVSYATARAVGLRAKIDREIGYHKTISNVPIPGVNGITSPRTWDLNSADTEMGLINGADVTGLIQRTGFRFWGNRTCSADPRFSFESAVRTNQIIRDIIVDALFPYIDQPLTAGLAAHLIEGINALLRREALAGRIIGGKAFLAAGNTPDQLSAGKLRLGYRFTDAAPLEDLGVESEITDEFYADTFKLAA